MSIIEISANDQFMRVTGDTPLLEVYNALPAGLFVPFPPVELPHGVGGLLERGGFAQNFFFSAEVLGAVFESPSGKILRAGGQVIKNVQGYDLVRPLIGSFGAMGRILEVTLRLRPGRAAVLLKKTGTLNQPEGIPPQVRFAWQDGKDLYVMHYGSPRAITKLRETFGGEEVLGQLNYLERFALGMGVGEKDASSEVQDLRFGWANSVEKPAVPELFARFASSL
jgi:glycolate oxidase FAD binding subunit